MRERELEGGAQAVDDPRLHLIHRHGRVLREPPNDAIHDRESNDVARPQDPVAVGEPAQAPDQVRRLPREGNSDERRRQHDCERDGDRHEERRPAVALLPPEAIPETGIERVQQEGEQERPEDRTDEGLQNRNESRGEQRRDDEPEDPRIEAVVRNQRRLLCVASWAVLAGPENTPAGC